MQLLDDPDFLEKSFALVEYYREYPEIAAYDLLNVDLSSIQKVVLRAMWTKNYVITIQCRGSGKTYLLAVFACLKALLYPGHRVGLLAPTFRQCVVGDTLVNTEKGLVYVKDLDSKPEQLRSSLGMQKCGDFWQVEKKPTLKVTTQLGFQLEGALGHKVLTIDDAGRFCYKKLERIAVGDSLFISKGAMHFGDKVDLTPFVKDFPATGNYRDCFIPPVLDERLSYFLGLLTGDGGLTVDNYLGFTNTDQDVLALYKKVVFSYFGKHPSEQVDENGKYTLSTGSKKFFHFLKAVGLGGKYAQEKSFPEIILRAPKRDICAYVRGLFDTDGGAYLYPGTSHRYKVSFTSTSARLVEELQLVLLGLGIISSRSENNSGRKRTLYQLEISNKKSVLTFHEHIGFSCQRKAEVLDCIVREINNTDLEREHFDRIPNLEVPLRALCVKIRKQGKGFGYLNLWKTFDNDGNLRSKGGITRTRLSKLLQFAEEKGIHGEEVDNLRTALEKKGVFCQTVSIEPGYACTYDFTVDKAHDYFSNGFISHNSKMIFDECNKLWQRSTVFQTSTERKPTQQSDNCYIRFRAAAGRNPSLIQCLPLGDGSKIRGSRFFTIVCDEFPHIPPEIFNMVIRPMAATTSDPMERVRSLEQQRRLLEKGLVTEEDIEREKQSTNQIVIASSGYFTFNHMYDLYKAYKEQMFKGNDKYRVFRIPYHILPEGFLDEENVQSSRAQMSSLEFRMEYEADFIPDTDSFYKASLLDACSRTSFTTQLHGSPGKSYCLGIDPARTEDAFAIVVAELSQPARVVHALELHKTPFPQMAAVIENLCRDFHVEHIYMDSQGGGLAIKDILAQNLANDGRGPILDPQDEVHQLKKGRHILKMCDPSVNFISESNFAALRLLEHRDILFPCVPLDVDPEADPSLAKDESWQTIQKMKMQMQTIAISETPTGKHHFDLPKGEAKIAAIGQQKRQKDLYSAFVLAARCVYDVLWAETLPESVLHHGGVLHEREKPSAAVGNPALGQSGYPIPQSLMDKLEIANDPEGYRQRMLGKMSSKRKVLFSDAAVLTPKPKKK